MVNNKMIVAGLGLVVLVVIGSVALGTWNEEGQKSYFANQGNGYNQSAIQAETPRVVTEVPYTIDESDFVDTDPFFESVDVSSVLSDEEIAGLLLMREEEKLARDVYMTLADVWGVRMFSNIASSEATHMTAMGDLISRYNLTDPVANDVRGVFTNPELQIMYNDLVARGSVSVSEAFQVGALIEDLDIYDLQNLLAQTDKVDIISVYENLQKGSRNHLRAFTKQIEQGGNTYQPVYISDAQYQAIVGSDQERGRM